jgi:uncharacterized protein (DUF1810 family)
VVRLPADRGARPQRDGPAVRGPRPRRARAYVAHPLLGRRLVESARALTALDTDNPDQVFGPIDAQKLHSSMTLFARAAPDQPVFREVLDHYFGGAEDNGTTSRL